MGEIQVRGRNELLTGQGVQTSGMTRSEVALGENSCAVEVRTQPGAVSGWHHHGDHDTYGYVVSGKLRLEFGPGGSDTVEAECGDYFVVPARTIHRESNPTSEEQVLVGFRVGDGPTVFNLDGPEGS